MPSNASLYQLPSLVAQAAVLSVPLFLVREDTILVMNFVLSSICFASPLSMLLISSPDVVLSANLTASTPAAPVATVSAFTSLSWLTKSVMICSLSVPVADTLAM